MQCTRSVNAQESGTTRTITAHNTCTAKAPVASVALKSCLASSLASDFSTSRARTRTYKIPSIRLAVTFPDLIWHRQMANTALQSYQTFNLPNSMSWSMASILATFRGCVTVCATSIGRHPSLFPTSKRADFAADPSFKSANSRR